MPIDIKDEVAALNLGSQIRQLRNQRGLTLQDVSELTGLSKPHLSQIENDLVSPPLATLIKISTALGVKIGYFFQDSKPETRIVVDRKKDHKNRDKGSQKISDSGYNYDPLAYPMVNKFMEPFVIYMEDRKEKDLIYNNHRGEEFAFIIQGKAEIRCADQIVVLDEGDSVYFDSGLPHAYRGIDCTAQLLIIIYSPSQSPSKQDL